MPVIQAKSAGFCYGVRRAVELAEKTARETGGCVMLGSLIHNANVVARLEQRGTSQPYDQVLREIVDRDYADTHRAIAPLRRAEDAVELDTGALTFEESLRLLLETIRRRAKL